MYGILFSFSRRRFVRFSNRFVDSYAIEPNAKCISLSQKNGTVWLTFNGLLNGWVSYLSVVVMNVKCVAQFSKATTWQTVKVNGNREQKWHDVLLSIWTRNFFGRSIQHLHVSVVHCMARLSNGKQSTNIQYFSHKHLCRRNIFTDRLNSTRLWLRSGRERTSKLFVVWQLCFVTSEEVRNIRIWYRSNKKLRCFLWLTKSRVEQRSDKYAAIINWPLKQRSVPLRGNLSALFVLVARFVSVCDSENVDNFWFLQVFYCLSVTDYTFNWLTNGNSKRKMENNSILNENNLIFRELLTKWKRSNLKLRIERMNLIDAAE